MYNEFKTNLMLVVLSYMIINIYMINGEKVVIGEGGVHKNVISFRPFGFYIKEENSAKWYNYANIVKIEVYGHES